MDRRGQGVGGGEKQPAHALLQSEIAEKKREWGEVAWKKMAEGDLQAVTAIFEKYQAKIQELEQQIATKECARGLRSRGFHGRVILLCGVDL